MCLKKVISLSLSLSLLGLRSGSSKVTILAIEAEAPDDYRITKVQSRYQL